MVQHDYPISVDLASKINHPNCRYIHYQTDEAMASKSAEAEDVDLYIANIQTAREGYDGQRDDLSLYEAYLTNNRASSSPIRERHVPDIC